MAGKPVELTVNEDQVLYFRARRGHLAGPGAASAAEAARATLGAQAQQLPPALHALSLRTRERPTAAALRKQLFEAPRSLVRTWGQRDTLHLYDPVDDWATVVAARGRWAPGGRGGPMPPESAVDRALKVMRASPTPVTRSDLLSVPPRSYVRAVAERAGAAGLDVPRFAAARLIWRLALRGDACLGDNIGSERRYATRSAWFPKLAWPSRSPSPARAATDLARRYLAVHGPATATDVAHFFGARVSEARRWLGKLEPELTPVRCGDRGGLVARIDDVADLDRKPPSGSTSWPARLLPLWEAMLMGHADKSWTVPDESERKLVWRKAAFVSAVVLARGRVVATWSQKKRGRKLFVAIAPLGRWNAKKHAAQVRREAGALARHLDLEGAEISITA